MNESTPTWWTHDTLSTEHVDKGVCSTSRTERMCLHCQKVHGGMYVRTHRNPHCTECDVRVPHTEHLYV